MKRLFFTLFFLSCLGSVLYAQTLPQVSTYGGTGLAGHSNGSLNEASFNAPSGMCSDAAGNLYVVDQNNHSIRKITPTGQVSTFAGSGSAGFAEGAGSQARFNNPSSICIDANGNLYVSDIDNRRVRKITPAGVVSTVYTIPEDTKNSIGGLGGLIDRVFYSLQPRISIDPSGNLYISVFKNELFNPLGILTIYKISPAGVVTTLQAPPSLYSTGASLTSLYSSPSGTLFASTYTAIYRYDSTGKPVLWAGSNYGFIAGVSIFLASNWDDSSSSSKGYFSSISEMYLDTATGIMYVADQHKIRKVSANGYVTTVAGSLESGSVDAIGTQARFNTITGICRDASGALVILDKGNHKLRKIENVFPALPQPTYLNLPSSLCLGSSINTAPTTEGGLVSIQAKVDSLENVSAPKSICNGPNGELFVLNGSDSILRYDSTGALLQVYNDMQLITNVKDIAVDALGRVYAIADGVEEHAVHRLNADGSLDFGFLASGLFFSYPVAIAIGPDGAVYVSDTVGGISTVNPEDGTVTLFADHTVGAYNVTDMAFGKNNKLFILRRSTQTILSRTVGSTEPFMVVLSGLDSMKLDFDKLAIDTLNGLGNIYLSSSTTGKMVQVYGTDVPVTGGNQSANSVSKLDYSTTANVNFTAPAGLAFTTKNGLPTIWVADAGSGQIKSVSVFGFSISPELPEGLSFDFLTGRIIGTPISAAPATIYHITVYDEHGIATTTDVNFAVDPSGMVNNVNGTNTSGIQTQPDGYNMSYFEKNNCSEIIRIEDEADGNNIGTVQVNQTVFPTVASFSTNTFVGRVTDINTQNPEAEARLKFYYTFLDIEHFNQSNGADPDLMNDTTTGTMQVGVLQLHTDSNGRKEQIKHNPVTAKWSTDNQVWVVDLKVDKFSTFYMGESGQIANVDCSNAGTPEDITACGKYEWRGKRLSVSGTYYDTLANVNGCDSVLTLNLTITNDIEVTTYIDSLVCNTEGAQYQWLNCNNHYALIPNATSSYFKPTEVGYYSVSVTINNCTDTSACVWVDSITTITIPTGINDVTGKQNYYIYPNPSQGIINIDMDEDMQVSVVSIVGETIVNKTFSKGFVKLDLSDYVEGMYVIYLTSGTKVSQHKILIRR